MKIIIVAVCFLAIAAAVPCFPPPNMKLRPETCCEFPKFPKEEEMAEECMKKYGAQTTRLMADKSPGPKRGSCVAECVYNATGHHDLDDKMSPEIMIKEAQDKGITGEWLEVFKPMAEKCFAEGKKRMDEFEEGFKLPPLDPADPVCHPKYQFGIMCTMKEMISNCPAKYYKDTPECKELQDHSKTCTL